MNVNNTELKIVDLIKLSETEGVWLPEFQRPFVWDKNQVRLLIDSLYNNYTISSILLWTGGDELARRRVGANIKDIKIPQDSSENVVYLLDGQQRTTALTLAFTDKDIYRGNNIKKREKINIYFDSEYKGDDPEMRWILDDEKIANKLDPESPLMLRDLRDQEIYNQFGTRFVKIKHTYNFDDSIIENWFNTAIPEEEIKMLRFKNDYNKILKTLEKEILERKVYDIEQKGTLEQVLEVFERINTKNTKLSIFDIMVAKTYRKFPQGFFDLRSYYKIANYTGNVKPDYFENLNSIDLDKVSMIVDESFMLQLSMNILNKKFKATEILKIRTSDLMENTKYLHDKFHLIIDFMYKHFNISAEELNLYQPIMKFLAAALSHYTDIDIEKQEMLKSWFWNTLLKNRYPGAQNERIAKDYKIITENDHLDNALDIFMRDNTRSFNDIKNISLDNFNLFDAHYSSRSQQIYRAFLLLLKSKNAKDFYSGIMPVKSGAASNRLEEHHIFPKNSSLGKEIKEKYKENRFSEIINNIANISFLTNETNNKRIKNKLPSEYITDFEKEYKSIGKYEEFIEILDSQFISTEMIEMLKCDKFEEFIIERTKLLHEHIEKLCKKKHITEEIIVDNHVSSETSILSIETRKEVKLGDNYTKPIKGAAQKTTLSNIQNLQQKFWDNFKVFAQKKYPTLRLRKTAPQQSYDISIGRKDCYLALAINSQKKEIACSVYIPNSQETFEQFSKEKDEINKLIPGLVWMELPSKKVSRIEKTSKGNIREEENWIKCFEWLGQTAFELQDTFNKY